MALILILPFITILSACDFNKDNSGMRVKNLELSYIKNLKMNMNDKQGLSMKKVSYNSDDVNLQMSSALLSFGNVLYAEEDITPEKYMLFTTTQTYSTGNVVYNENSIEKVTFTKKSNITEETYDANGNLITSTTEITQEEIPGQINKLYVFGNYTFIQFVPLLGESGIYKYLDNEGNIQREYLEIRSNKLIYDVNGVAEFDKTNYYSSALSQSFVINNETGYIYRIENFVIDNITETGVITDKNNGRRTPNYYRMKFVDNNLVFEDVAPDKSMQVDGVVLDKYGWIFVQNDLLDYKDIEKKIIYYKHTNYHYLIDGNKQVYLFKYKPNTLLDVVDSKIVDGEEHNITSEFTASGLKYIATNRLESIVDRYYKGKIVYNLKLYSPKGINVLEDSMYISTSTILDCYWLNQNSNTIITEYNGNLYFKNINFDDYIDTENILGISDFTKISNEKLYKKDKFYLDIDGNKKEVDNVYYKVDENSTTYYQLVKNGNSFNLVRLVDTSYEQNVYIFQPINY